MTRPRVVALFALLFLAGHLPFLPSTPDDIDSVNFALGVRQFDVAAHQPHPPGYPIVIALGKTSHWALARLGVTRGEAPALAVWGAIFGTLALWPLRRLFEALELDASRAAAATIVTMTCPLLWLTAARPLSDVPGFAAGVLPQALLFGAFRRQRDSAATPGNVVQASGRLIVLGALTAGIAIGFRAQTAWLTLPLLASVLIDRIGRGVAAALLGVSITLPIGVLLWLVPLGVAAGGPSAYARALGSQAGEDIAWVEMVATNPTPRAVAFALVRTFVWPWESTALAVVVLVLALVGLVAMLVRARLGLWLLAVAFVPYAAFHLLFQDTVFTRYALPLVPAVAYLAVRGADAAVRRGSIATAAALAVATLTMTAPSVWRYGGEGSPPFRALSDASARGARARTGVVVAMHHAVARELRGERWPVTVLPSPPKHEWLEVVRHWRSGASMPVWFLAETRRTDLQLIDPHSRRLVQPYRWAFPTQPLMGGLRPEDIDWIEIRDPGWFAAEGWALTPETAGVANADGVGPSRHSIAAFVRRRSDPLVLLVGGRHLGRRGDPDVRFDLTIDGQPAHAWQATPEPGFFLELVTLPPDATRGEGRYARLEIASRPIDGSSRQVPTAIEQFDVQPPPVAMIGYGPGWHELEYNPVSGQLWRWSSDASTLVVHHGGRDVTLLVRGESPLRYFDAAPSVVVRAGSEVLARFSPTSDFAEKVRVPVDALDRAAGRLTLTTDHTFVPDERSGNGDRRRLGLRIYEVRLF